MKRTETNRFSPRATARRILAGINDSLDPNREVDLRTHAAIFYYSDVLSGGWSSGDTEGREFLIYVDRATTTDELTELIQTVIS